MQKEALIQVIKKTFDSVEQPLDMTLHVAEAHGWYDYDHDDSHKERFLWAMARPAFGAHKEVLNCTLFFK